jgi:hypothetical protein
MIYTNIRGLLFACFRFFDHGNFSFDIPFSMPCLLPTATAYCYCLLPASHVYPEEFTINLAKEVL